MSRYIYSVAIVLLMMSMAACQPAEEESLVVYSGRSESLVEPIIERFDEEADVSVDVRYGETAQLALTLEEEGDQSQADVFWAQDAGALGALHEAGLLAPLPDSLLQQVTSSFRGGTDTWVPITGRARTLAYSPERVDTTELPESIFELTDPQYEGRVGWAPTNGSFQSFVTAMRAMVGDDSTRAWLEAMAANGARSYPRNSAIVQAIAAGEIDFGLPNHYYLYRFKSEDPEFPVEQTFFAPGDAGNLVNVAGVGVLRTSDREEAAYRFIGYLLSQETQEQFTTDTYEYPVIEGVEASAEVAGMQRLQQLKPGVDLNELRDLEATLAMLRDVGVL